METNEGGPSGLAPHRSLPLTPSVEPLRENKRSAPRVTVAAPPATSALRGAVEVAGMLLPGERVTLRSTPHPIIFFAPLVRIVAFAVALTAALNWKLWVVVNGHHTFVPLLSASVRQATIAVGGLLILQAAAGLASGLLHYLGFRVIATNRRVFVIDGLLGRKVTPLGNTALARATMSQSLFGRIFGFGTIVLPSNLGGRSAISAIREPVALYRELEAVAHGVDGDTWTPAVRQTRIP